MKMKYDFVPADVVIGRFKMTNAFVTCKYNYDKWQNVTIFERLCGYKPHEQRDPEKQLKKAIYNAVDSISNCPTSGFKFVDHDKDLYSLSKKNYYSDDITDVMLQDPRGFIVAVTSDNFYYMLDKCSGNMKDYVLDHKFAYAWSKDYGRFMLVDAETEEFEKCKIKSDKFKNKVDNNTYVSIRDLKVGSVYLGSDKFKGKYMYLGKMEVYDNNYHLDAMRSNKYKDIDEYKRDCQYGDITSKDKHVFYRVSKKPDESGCQHPFVFKSSVYKLLESEISETSFGSMFNDKSKAITYDNIKKYMETCLLFNKVDLSSIVKGSKAVNYYLFNKALNYGIKSNWEYGAGIDNYPFTSFDTRDYAYLIKGDCRGHQDQYLKIGRIYHDTYGTGPSYTGRYAKIISRSYSYNSTGGMSFEICTADGNLNTYGYSYQSKRLDYLDDISDKDLYDYLQPAVATAKLENGNEVKEQYMLILQSCMQ